MTGFIVENVEIDASAVQKIESLSRAACRYSFEERFTVSRMAAEHVSVYESVIEAGL